MALTNQLISFWELEEAAGTRMDSVVASGNNLTDNNTVTQTTGKVGNAAEFTFANSESLSHVDNTSLSTGDIDFSFVCWVYLADLLDNYPILSKGNSAIAEEYLLRLNLSDTRFHFFIFDSGGSIVGNTGSTTSIPSAVTWYFIFCSHDSVANTVNISINDGTVESVATTGVPTDTSQIFSIGARVGASQFMEGRIDQVGFWKRILTAGEITQLYNGGAGLSYAAMTTTPIVPIGYSLNYHR